MGYFGKGLTLHIDFVIPGYKKVADVLTGEIIPVNEKNRDSVNKKFPLICKNVNPIEILPTLLKYEAIGEIDHQRIMRVSNTEGTIIAMLELLFVIPNRHQHWFRIFMEALIDNNSGHVAEKIDTQLYEGKGFCCHSSFQILFSI